MKAKFAARKTTLLTTPLCFCICDRFAHTLTAPGCQSGSCLSLSPLTHLLSSNHPPSLPPLYLYTYRGLWQGCSSAAVEGAPLCLSRAVSQAILSPVLLSLLRRKVAEPLSVGCQGRAVQVQTRRHNVELSGPSGKSFRVKSSFKHLFSWRSSAA